MDPITGFCREVGLSVRELAIVTDMDETTLRYMQQGRAKRLSKKLRQALKKLGYDGDAMADEYDRWRHTLADQVKRELLLA